MLFSLFHGHGEENVAQHWLHYNVVWSVEANDDIHLV